MRRERPAGRNPDDDAARQAILAAARDCFTRKGYDGTTMREVAQAAGCDAAALKRHFKSKDRLFVRAMAGVVGPGSARGRSAGDTARMRLEYETRLALQESAYKEKLQEIEASLQEQVGNLERIIGALAKELRRAMQARNPRRR